MEDAWSSFIKVLLIVIILSILGINVFYYVARATDSIAGATKGVAELTGGAVSKTLGLAGEGIKTTADIAAGVTKDAVDVTGGILSSGVKDLERVLDISVAQRVPRSDSSSSSVQEPRKSGYCYIGSEKGFRSCMYVNKTDQCMSGEVYPSMDICINPKLRV